MGAKVCPLLSSGTERIDCIEQACALYHEGKNSSCKLRQGHNMVAGRIDTVTAQLQEMQIALIELMNASKLQSRSAETMTAQMQEMQIALLQILNENK